MMKKSLVLALVLSALLLVTVMAVSVSADASLTIGTVTKNVDIANNLVTFTVPYTAVEVDQITVIAVKGPASEAPAPDEGNIVYFNQQSSASSSFTFSVPYNAFSASEPYCWIKIGGTAIATASSDGGQEVWATAATPVYGDVSGDGEVTLADLSLAIKLFGALSTGNEIDASDFDQSVEAAIACANVDGEGDITVTDISLFVKYFGLISSGTPLDSEFPDGKFPAYSK